MVGTKGKVIYDTYGLKSRLLPDSLHKSVGDPPRTLAAHHDEPRNELVERVQGRRHRRRRRSSTRRS